MEDHPRGCGEHKPVHQLFCGDIGSSPRMRGTHNGIKEFVAIPRIIPADAGNTCGKGSRLAVRVDHPRGCGEHHGHAPDMNALQGSSPRMRGTRCYVNPIIEDKGIIPADAGNTLFAVQGKDMTGDHPRGCGEHGVTTSAPMVAKGSSPRMRGTLHLGRVQLLAVRIIPADAGNTNKSVKSTKFAVDHPRGCGEHIVPCAQFVWIDGSSPRMRGTRHHRQWSGFDAGIIPADAGNTKEAAEKSIRRQDHPRGCGEHCGSG